MGLLSDVSADFSRWLDIPLAPGTLGYKVRVALLEPGFHCVLFFRVRESFARIPVVGRFLRRVLWYFQTLIYSCDLGVGLVAEGGLYLPHPIGIVVHSGSNIGRSVTIQQGVTIGLSGAVRDGVPVICAGAVLGTNAVILGRVRVGEDARVGAGAVVIRDVPSGSLAVGVPARVVIRAIA